MALNLFGEEIPEPTKREKAKEIFKAFDHWINAIARHANTIENKEPISEVSRAYRQIAECKEALITSIETLI